MNDNIIMIQRKHAKTIGMQFYFTGKECKHKHIALRYTTSGKCLTCQKIQSKKWNNDHSEEITLKSKSPEGKEGAKRSYNKSYANNHTKWLWKGLKSKSKRKGIIFDIKVSDIIIPEYCPVLGIKLEVNKGRPKGNSPSVDRIIPELGYIPSNIIIISCRANTIKNDVTVSELGIIYNFYKDLLI